MKRANANSRPSNLATVRVGLFSLLVLVHLARPAIALRSCEAESDCCCAAPPAQPAPLAPVAAAPSAGGCCVGSPSDESEDSAAPAEFDRSDDPARTRDRTARSGERCECRVDPAPAPSPERVVPPRESQDGDAASPRTWLRVHAGISARTPWPLPGGGFAPGVTDGSVEREALSRDLARLGRARVPSAGSWSLARGGVPGLLALLSVARL